MPGTDAARAPRTHPSPLESFLDDYQLVRLVVGSGGLITLALLGLSVGYGVLFPYLVGLAVTTAHATWVLVRDVRAVKSLLAIDTTVWGAIIVVTDDPVTGTAMLALLLVLIAAFADGAWRVVFAAVAMGWYAIAFFSGEGVSAGSVSRFVGMSLIVGALTAIMGRIRTGLGRMEANRSQLLGTVSHELRNNLTGLMGLTEVVSTDRSLDPAEAGELIGLAHQQAVDAGAIVEDLLTATRLEGAALNVGIEAVDVRREVDAMLRRFSSEGLIVDVDLAEELPAIAADPLRLRQILRNLVSNAVRYGGGTIRITARPDDDRIVITVADDGEGVPVKDEANIFLPYRRSSRPHHASSVGLGLWISRALAQAMGGSLDYSRHAGWTQFTVSMPIHQTTASPGSQRVSPRGLRWRRSVPSHAEATHRSQ